MEYTSSLGSIESYFPLVDKILRHEFRSFGLSRQMSDELRSYGREGLFAAMRDYDPSRGSSFPAYAKRRIRWAVYDGMRDVGWFPRHLLARVRFQRKAEEVLAAKEDTPAPADSTEAVHRLSDAVHELAMTYVVSHCEPLDETGETPDAEEALVRKQYLSAVRSYVLALPDKERFLIQRFFFDDVRISDIALEMEVSVSWASRILTNALRRLRHLLEKRET